MGKQKKGVERRDFLKAGLWVTAGTVALRGGTARSATQDETLPRNSEESKDTGIVMLDTEALIWVDQDDQRLGVKTRTMVDAALGQGSLYVSSVSFWEVISLVRQERIEMPLGVSDWRRSLMDAGLKELGVDGIIGIPEDDKLDGDYFKSAMLCVKLNPLLKTPRDRLISTPPHLLGSLIVASAIRLGATFVTTDENLLHWSSDELKLDRQDARK